MTVRSGTPSAASTAKVSSQASRVWTTSVRPSLVGQPDLVGEDLALDRSRGEWS